VVAVRGDLEPRIPDDKKKGEVRKIVEKKIMGRESSNMYSEERYNKIWHDKNRLNKTRISN
jgi:hypothetical protein